MRLGFRVRAIFFVFLFRKSLFLTRAHLSTLRSAVPPALQPAEATWVVIATKICLKCICAFERACFGMPAHVTDDFLSLCRLPLSSQSTDLLSVDTTTTTSSSSSFSRLLRQPAKSRSSPRLWGSC